MSGEEGRKSIWIDHPTDGNLLPAHISFKGERPTIGALPSLLRYGQTFTVQSPDAASITKISIVKLPAMTH